MSAQQLAALADALARHAIPWLVAGSAGLLIVAITLWRGIERYAPPMVARLTPHWSRFDRRAFAARYLGWHAAVAFVVVAVGVLAFDALAEHLDDPVLRAMAVVTHLGDVAVLTTLTIGVTVGLAIRRRFLLATSFALSAAGGGLLIRVLKAVFERTRPERLHAFATVDGYSFPSGHAAGSMLVYGLAAYLLIRHLPRRWHLPVGAAALLLIVIVGASRVLLQVHYASDVLAGWTVAGSWGALCVAGYEGVRLSARRRHPR